MSMRVLDESDLEHILLGCAVLGTGGGGELEKGLERVKTDLKNGKEFRIASLDEVPDHAMVASPYYCGSLTPANSQEQAQTPQELLSFIALQQYLREDFFAAVSTELGGGNTAVALSVAANMGIPIVDGDPAGRSVPELQHTIFFLKGVSIVPLGVATKSGDVVIVKEVANHIRAEKIVRSIAVASGGTVGVTDHPMRGKELKAAIIAGAISHAETIGAVLKTTSDYEKVAEAGGGCVLFKGEVAKSLWKDEGGFTVGEIHVTGAHEYMGSVYKVWYKNEHLMAWRDNQIDITTPDLICILSEKDAMPVTNPHCTTGMKIAVIGYPASEEWRTKVGLAALGPRSFGFDCDYLPFEEKMK
jgi:DUF917 family protein